MSAFLLVLCLAVLPQGGRAAPEPSGCSSPEAMRVAEEVLEQINQDQTRGYILCLNRLYDVSTTQEKKGGLLYQLTIDVMETKCHITSRKSWKQCEVRYIGDVPVYGECKISVYVDTQVKLQSFSCAVRQGRSMACQLCILYSFGKSQKQIRSLLRWVRVSPCSYPVLTCV